MTSSAECVLPLSCSCSNCDWKLCCMKSNINKEILVCGCDETNKCEQFVYTCTTSSGQQAAKHMKVSEPFCTPEEQKKVCYEKQEENLNCEPPNKSLKKSSKDKINVKNVGKKSQKCFKIDNVSKQRIQTICKSRKGKNKTVQVSSDTRKDIKDKESIFVKKSKSTCKKNDLYSKIEEIYKICCCELCNCPPSSPSYETFGSNNNLLNFDDKRKQVCLCYESHKQGSERNKGDVRCKCLVKPKGFGISKPCPCHAINNGAISAVPLQSPSQGIKIFIEDKNQPGPTSPKPSKASLTSPRSSNVGLIIPEKQAEELKSTESLFNGSCHKKQEKQNQVQINHDDCPCYSDVDIEDKSEEECDPFPICDYPTSSESSSLVCSCIEGDITEDVYPTCARPPDGKEVEECPCNSVKMPTASANDSTDKTREACKCDSCECINCSNTDKKHESIDKANEGIRKRMCKCTNSLVSTSHNGHNICKCIMKSNPDKKSKSNIQIKKYDVHRSLICENLPFIRIATGNSVCEKVNPLSVTNSFKDNRKCKLSDCYIICNNNLHEYENILSAMNRCGCSPCECQFCNKNDTDDITGLEKYKACRCVQCDCIYCSNLPYDNRHLETPNNTRNKKLYMLQDIKRKINNVKSNNNDILYENLTLLKKGEILTNFKTNKEELENNQLICGLNKDLALHYVVVDENVQVINKDFKHMPVTKNLVKRNNKEKTKVNKNITIRKVINKSSKECLNLLLPSKSNSGFIKKSLITIEPVRTDLNLTNEGETVRNIKIYIKLKNICDNADEYIKHLKVLLEESKKDSEYYDCILQKIRNIQNMFHGDINNNVTKVSRVLDLLRKENDKK